MEIKLNSTGDDRFRVYANTYCKEIFCDVSGPDVGVLCTEHYGFCGYIEARLKERVLKTFQFTSKSYKKDFDFGWWGDAEIVYSYDVSDEKG